MATLVSAKRIGGVFLILVGALLLLRAASSIVHLRVTPVPLLLGLSSFILGWSLLRAGERKFREATKHSLSVSQLTALHRVTLGVAVFGILGGLALYYIVDVIRTPRVEPMAEIEKEVADDAVARYQIAKRQGTAVDACVQAGFVVAAYLLANDEAQYKQWKQVERIECAAAGVEK